MCITALLVQSRTGLYPEVLNSTVLEKVAESVFLLNFLMLVAPAIRFETCWSRVVKGRYLSYEFSPYLNLLPCRITPWPTVARQWVVIYSREMRRALVEILCPRHASHRNNEYPLLSSQTMPQP